MVIDWIVAALILLGALFTLIAAVGVLRLPDVLIRMHASTKAGTLGCGLILVALAVDAGGDIGILARAVAAFIFLLLTAPVAAHMIGRAAYCTGVPLWDQTKIDEMKNTPGHEQRTS